MGMNQHLVCGTHRSLRSRKWQRQLATVAVLGFGFSCFPAGVSLADLHATSEAASDTDAGSSETTPEGVDTTGPPAKTIQTPALPKNSGRGRRVIYKNNLQWVWIVDAKNKVVRAIPVSGRRGVPSVGTYKVNSQSLRSYSLDLKDVWFNNMTRFAFGPNGGNIGFHAIPTKYGKPLQTAEQLGSFQGSGCIRMAIEDAKLMYNFAKLGTTIVVIP